jgi:hypothetical protein
VANILYLQGLFGVLKSTSASEQVPRLDQTTRIHAALPTDKGDKESMLSWHEVGRPQVHGYDLVGVVSLDQLRFISIADEKVARVFGAPRGFVQIMRGLDAVDLNVDVDEVGCSDQYMTDSLSKAFETGDTPHECDCTTTGPIQQSHERWSGPQIFIMSFSLKFSSSPCFCLGLTSAFRGRARFHYAMARDREGLWPRLRGFNLLASLKAKTRRC